MGELLVKSLGDALDRAKYIDHLIKDIEAMQEMLAQGLFEKTPLRIGAEQEFCLVDEAWNPATKAMEILNDLDDPHFTTELALYNLEANLDPVLLGGECFSKMHGQLDRLLTKAKVAAEKHGVKILLTGILPTITTRHMQLSYMTPMPRYRELNEAIRQLRKSDMELHIKGVDEINLHHDSILYEGCNTSFQSHLQIDPDDFEDTYNWAQAIAGPILSVCTNSPMLMGKELWNETRIALFSQSVDTRVSSYLLNEREARVGFGNDWAKGSIIDFYKDSIVRFRSLLTATFEGDSVTELRAGKIPKLKALSLHNGTVYKWNRLCYGITQDKPHVRLECRYMPSGPSTVDEIANMMFWTGVMLGRPQKFKDIRTKMDFKEAKDNFFHAARYGMAAQFHWEGKLVSSQSLILDQLLPMAYTGLFRMNVSPKDAERYLSIIEHRVNSRNGSEWALQAGRRLKKQYKLPEALKILTATTYERQQKGYAVDAWELPRGDELRFNMATKQVGDCMNTDVITAQETDSAALVLKMMQWNNIHHLPILNDTLDLIGLLTWTDVAMYLENPKKQQQSVAKIMRRRLITTTAEIPMTEAKTIMTGNAINCLPVVKGKKLVGIISSKDF
jgi:CBS domain-containing protein/gamma-glutamyl:cysteine ligase YbdK (ATP-grasp superfamily)